MSELAQSNVTELTTWPSTLPSMPGREIQELWFALSRRTWQSVVLVPAGLGGSTTLAAVALAEVGRRLRLSPVTAVMAEQLDYETAAQLVRRVVAPRYADAEGNQTAPEQVVVAIPPVVSEPLGIAVAREADVAVVCVQLGTTGLEAARQTIALIGRDRVAGCLLLR